MKSGSRWAALLVLLLTCGAFTTAQAQEYPPIAAQKTDTGFQIGPYPVPYEYEGSKTILWTWLRFRHEVIGRAYPTYKLYMTLLVQFNHMPRFFEAALEKNWSMDNCGRINAVDNWVYALDTPRVELRDNHNIYLETSAYVSTWSCFENPVPETVCDEYSDSFGFRWPYNCRLRSATPIKWMNLEVGIDANVKAHLSAADGALVYKVEEPYLRMDDDAFFSPAVNLFADFLYNIPTSIHNAVLQPSRVSIEASQDFAKFNPRYEDAGFQMVQGAEFVYVTASVSITSAQINEFMRNAIGPLWDDVVIVPSPPEPDAWTKSRVRSECADADVGTDWNECLALMGLPYVYEELPD
jgi:hypothetical protein